MKPKKFTIEPYKNALYLFCPCSKAEAEAWCKRKKILDHMDFEEYDTQDALTFYTTAGNFIFMHKFDDTPAGIGILVHELCHATFNVLHAAGVKEAEGTEEAAAYLIDNMTEKCIKHLRAQATKATEVAPSSKPAPQESAPGTHS